MRPGSVYYLTCWTTGDRVNGPGGRSNLWYRLTQGGYAADTFLFTGTNDPIPRVRHR